MQTLVANWRATRAVKNKHLTFTKTKSASKTSYNTSTCNIEDSKGRISSLHVINSIIYMHQLGSNPSLGAFYRNDQMEAEGSL